jgi:hypothetical protein
MTATATRARNDPPAKAPASTPPHWLTRVGESRTPPAVVSFDTETTVKIVKRTEVMTLRCWAACLRLRGDQGEGLDTTKEFSGVAAGELVDVIEAAVGVCGEAWVFAHNLGFDLTVTSLPMILTERGWQSDFVNIGDESCVFVLSGPAGKLVITDSWSWLRCSLATAAHDVGMRKTRLPGENDDLQAWQARCRHDVRILDRLLADLLNWWDTQKLGPFAVTSAACGWRSMRAKIPEKTILVGPDPPRTGLEREAIYGGRKEVWRVGTITGRWIDDFDLVAAHLTTVANLPMPARPLKPGRLTASLSALAPPEELGAVCRVKITTRTPCAPVRVAGDAWWPTGKFGTVLTTAELPAVLETADRVEILSASWYWLETALQPWAQWCENLRAAGGAPVPAVVGRVAKGWGRSVPGRFALRTSTLIGEREATHTGWALETGHDLDTGDPLEIITYGGIERTYRKDQDGADVSPVVLAFVEGYVRAAISRVIAARNPCAMLQTNTDGWWEIRDNAGNVNAEDCAPEPWTVTRRSTARTVVVHGPNHVQTPSDRRLAGVPKDALPNLDGSFAWHDWPGLRWQLQFSRPGEYTRPGREMLLQDHYCRRWVTRTGETVPVTVRPQRSGAPRILPWSQTYGRLASDQLAAHQVPALQPLADDAPPSGPALLSPPPLPLGRA